MRRRPYALHRGMYPSSTSFPPPSSRLSRVSSMLKLHSLRVAGECSPLLHASLHTHPSGAAARHGARWAAASSTPCTPALPASTAARKWQRPRTCCCRASITPRISAFVPLEWCRNLPPLVLRTRHAPPFVRRPCSCSLCFRRKRCTRSPRRMSRTIRRTRRLHSPRSSPSALRRSFLTSLRAACLSPLGPEQRPCHPRLALSTVSASSTPVGVAARSTEDQAHTLLACASAAATTRPLSVCSSALVARSSFLDRTLNLAESTLRSFMVMSPSSSFTSTHSAQASFMLLFRGPKHMESELDMLSTVLAMPLV
mmetsp:Transcript_50433/g.122981  ORF Transcript_50433/g.122981 Transcript_50433/m.122981 type:complete len:312 (-) Transcript_50433:251-1186(-)